MEAKEAHLAVRRLALAQHGVVSRRQLRDLGVHVGFIDGALRSKRLLPVFPGAYVLGRQVDSYRSVWMAATLAAGPGAALSGSSAAAAWGFMRPTDVIEVARPAGRNRRFNGLDPSNLRFRVRVNTSRLLPGERSQIGPVPVASVVGTLIQLAGSQDEHELRRAFIEASRQRLLNEAVLEHCLAVGGSFKGRAPLARLIGLWRPESCDVRSGLEGEFLLLCAKHGIDMPQVNVRVCGFEVDCLWEDVKLIVELDGRSFHGDRFAFERDRERQNTLIRAGYSILSCTHLMVTRDPREVTRELKAVLDEAGLRSQRGKSTT